MARIEFRIGPLRAQLNGADGIGERDVFQIYSAADGFGLTTIGVNTAIVRQRHVIDLLVRDALIIYPAFDDLQLIKIR